MRAGFQPERGTRPLAKSTTTAGSLYSGVKTSGACNNKILLTVSSDGGSTFTGTTTDPRLLPVVNTANGQATTDQWWQWAAFTPGGTPGDLLLRPAVWVRRNQREHGRAAVTG